MFNDRVLHRPIHTVAVLGAGTMGSRIAAHLANQGVAVFFFDQPSSSPSDRNAAVRRALEELRDLYPPAFYDLSSTARVRLGNFAEDLPRLREADWVIEAITEDLEAKRALLTRVVPHLNAQAALTTTSSGLPIAQIGAGLPAEVGRRFFGTHFFNPPRYTRLLELIPTPHTDPAVQHWISDFADRRLGKSVLVAKDTPSFVAGRIANFFLMNAIHVMQEMRLTIEEVDALISNVGMWGDHAVFGTIDLVGVEAFSGMLRNSYAQLPNDECRDLFQLPQFMQDMLQRGWVGEKTGQGFYKRVERSEQQTEILTLDLSAFEYRPRHRVHLASLEQARNLDEPLDRLRYLIQERDEGGQFLWRILTDLFLYAAHRVPEIADEPYIVDQAMRWGYNWLMGPFELWDALDLGATCQRIRQDGRSLPPFVERLLQSGARAFYRTLQAPAASSMGRAPDLVRTLLNFSPRTLTYQPVHNPPGVLQLSRYRGAREVQRNPGCSMLDLGDGIGCLELHTRNNVMGPDIVQMVTRVLNDHESPFDAFVITSESEHFCSGLNLHALLMDIQAESWDEIEASVLSLQAMTGALKRSRRPVVVAPFGWTLGGGCEMVLNAAHVMAHAELYIGLGEPAYGLVPAGGGCKEMLLRAVHSALALQPDGLRPDGVEVQQAIRTAFHTILFSRVSRSAQQARQLGFLRSTHPVVANRDRLLAAAREQALHIFREGYASRPPETVPAPGRNLRATLLMEVYLMRMAETITEHEAKIAAHLAGVMSGGDVAAGVPLSEDYLLELEREAFLSLCGERRTQERLQYTAKTGQTLRN